MTMTELETLKGNPQLRERITLFEAGKDILQSQYGTVTYRKWCELEARRIGNCAVFEAFKWCCVVPQTQPDKV